MNAAPCPATKADGSACASPVRCPSGSGSCPSHCACADCAQRRAANAVKGGQAGRKTARVIPLADQPFGGKPLDLDEVARYTGWLVGAATSGALDARVAREASAALNVLRGLLAARDHAAWKVHQLKKQILKEVQARDRDPRVADQ